MPLLPTGTATSTPLGPAADAMIAPDRCRVSSEFAHDRTPPYGDAVFAAERLGDVDHLVEQCRDLRLIVRMLVGQKEFGGGRDLTRLVAWIRATESDQCQRSPSR